MIKHLAHNRYVKIALKITGIIIAIIFLLLTAVAIYIESNKADIIEKIKTQLSQAIKGDVIIKDMDISFIRSFPYAGINVYNVSILDSQYHKPLLAAKYVSCRINFLQIINPHPKISKLVIADGGFHFFTDTTLYTNAYLLLKKDTAKKSDNPPLIIKGVELHNVNVLIEDAMKHKRYEFKFNELHASIDKDDSLFTIKMDEQALMKGLGFNINRGSYLQNQRINSEKWVIRFNKTTKEVSFGKTEITINQHKYNIDGIFHLKDSAWFKLHVSTREVPYKQAMRILTERIRNKLSLLGIEKTLDAEAHLEGPLMYLSDPHIVVNWSTEGNEITTPVASFTDCSFSGTYDNRLEDSLPISDENSIVLVNKFKGNWGEIELNADSIRLVNMDDPVIKFNFLSQCSFETLNDQLSLETIQFTGGTAQLFLKYNGPLIASPALLSKITANIQLQDAALVYVPRDLTFTNCSGNVSISQNNITVDSLSCNIKQNHFEINIRGSNVNGLANEDLAKASIVCDVFTPSIDLDNFRSLFSVRKQRSGKKGKSKLAATAEKIDDFLNEGNLQLNVKASHVNMKNFNADNVVAQIAFRPNEWNIEKATLLHAGGNLSVTGDIRQVNSRYNHATTKLNVQSVDVRKLFYAFDNFGLNDLSYHNVRGNMNADADLAFDVSSNGRIIPGSMQGTVDFSIKNGALINFIPVEKIQDIAFLNRDLSNIEFAELKNKLTIKDNMVQIPRMEVASTAITMYVEGVYGYKGNTDISMQIPISNLKRQDPSYKPTNKGVDAKVGMSIYLRAKSDDTGKIKIGLELFKKRKKNKDKDNNDTGTR
jgi:hypothetical protein